MKRPVTRWTNAALLLSCAGLIAVQFGIAGKAQTASSSPSANAAAQTTKAKDPGVRGGAAAAGGPVAGLTPSEAAYFAASAAEFAVEEAMPEGLGPRMNLDSCGGCHSQPAIGGSVRRSIRRWPSRP